MAGKYNSYLDQLSENTSHRIILSSIAPDSAVLECGCASGYMTQYMKENLHAKVSIVEQNQSDYEIACQYAEDGICTNLEEKKWIDYFSKKRFDYILFADVLEHLHNPEIVLRRATDMLKENGTIVVSVPNIGHADIIINLMNGRWNYTPLGLLDNSHIHFWAEKNLNDLFLNSGLAVVKKEYTIMPPYTTEQKNIDRVEGMMPAIYTVCQQRYADVYQFVFFAQKQSYVQQNGILCFDNYPECHWKYSSQPACCEDYKKEQENLRVHFDSALHTLAEQSQTIERLSRLVEMQAKKNEQQLIQIDHLSEENKNIQDIQYQATRLRQQYDEKCREYDEISNAFFWKATKPLRATLDTMKRVFRHNKLACAVWSKLKSQTTAISESTPSFYNIGDPIVILCTLHTLYVAKLIRHALEKAGIPAQIASEEPSSYSDRVHIVICPQMFRNLPGRYIAFQMEQTISSRWLTAEYYNRLRHAHSVLDYSLVNIKYFRGAFDFAKIIYYLPIDYLPGLTKDPNEYQYEYDVVFYGDTNNSRRKRFLKALQKRFSVKVLSEVFGEELYDELRKAKVVVNIHYYENAMLETTRLYEVRSLGRSVIVSERSVDPTEETRLEEYVDFVPVSQIEKMIEQVDYWLSHEEDRLAEVKRHNEELSQRISSFDYFFYRYLLANDWIRFDRFYELAGGFVNFDGNRVCLSLPESVDRREEFDRENRYGFEVFPGLRHTRGWTGCGLSYKFIMKKAQEQHLKNIVVCEDDVLFPDGFEERWKKCMQYLSEHTEWNIFQGLMSDVGEVKISEVNRENGETFVHLDRMISTVFNLYDESVYPSLIAWDETNDDVYSNTIDRALEAMHLNIITTVPFLVGHKEDLSSEIWGFQNTEYNDMIARSSEKLVKLVEEYGADSTGGAV